MDTFAEPSVTVTRMSSSLVLNVAPNVIGKSVSAIRVVGNPAYI